MNDTDLTFTAPLWLHHVGSWIFVTVPEDLGDDVWMLAGPPRGFGWVRVDVGDTVEITLRVLDG